MKNKTFSIRRIQKESLAGFLQKEIIKKVNQESWAEYDYERPLKKIKMSKPKKGLLGWWSFFRNSVEQFRP